MKIPVSESLEALLIELSSPDQQVTGWFGEDPALQSSYDEAFEQIAFIRSNLVEEERPALYREIQRIYDLMQDINADEGIDVDDLIILDDERLARIRTHASAAHGILLAEVREDPALP